MIYNRECPNCGRIDEVEVDASVLEWVCEDCGTDPVISLPTHNGEVII
jgi:transcription initiation factor TFIIIB Brf1 subunit/transcription initiation factor TFIIB